MRNRDFLHLLTIIGIGVFLFDGGKSLYDFVTNLVS